MDPIAQKPAGEAPSPKTAKLLGLFLAAVLIATPGCGSSETGRAEHVHIDRNNDGYCDEDGEPMPAGGSGSRYYGGHSGYYGGYYSLPHYGGTTAGQPSGPSHQAGISSGSAPHGGIGGSSTGGGG